MMQLSVKTQIEQLKNLQSKVEAQIKPQLDKASAEAKKILKELGANLDEQQSLTDVVSAIRSHNPTLRSFLLSLDSATYDTRKRFEWNATMMSAYAKFQAEIGYEKNVKPLIENYIDSAERQFDDLKAKAHALKDKLRG